MMSLRKAGALVLALSCGVSLAEPRAAHAGTLLDLLFPKRQRSQEQTQPLPGAPVLLAPGTAGQPLNGLPLGDDPLPRVKAPSYYTYKADPMRLIATARFADPQVTSAVSQSAVAPVDPVLAQRQLLAEARVKTTDPVAKAIEAYYGAGKPLMFVSGSMINDRARSVLKTLGEADSVGLDPADYSVAVPPLNFDAQDVAGRNRDLMQFELALAAKALTYAQDAIRGRVDPNRISGYHDFKRKDVDLDTILKLVSFSPDAGAYLASRNPSNAEFAALRAELQKLKFADIEEGEPVVINLQAALKPGQSSPEVAHVVAAIRKAGSEKLKAAHAPVLAAYANTPEYSPELVSLVEDYQKEVGLKPDGVIGKATALKMMGMSNDSKVDKLIVAMEQLRWMPGELGPRYVFVNQPAFMAYYHNDNREQLSMRVVVGGPHTQTYFFNDQIETVELHPYWGVPASIIVNEMLPKLRQDPSYLDRLGYEVTYAGNKVSSTEINWGNTDKVGVRQPPGSDNALGELKILFPNSHSIYMHDTPSKSFFKRDMRALSHGCIRLAEPRTMAAAVLGTTVDDIAKQLSVSGNKAIPVPGKVPVYVSYFTAWPDKNGVVQYFDDVYGRDDYTRKAFATTTSARI
nr:L,D-transpeptidase family protein [uncultured Gellertiella sp.]